MPTLVQTISQAPAATPSTITLSGVVAGNLLTIVQSEYTAGVSISGITGGGTWVNKSTAVLSSGGTAQMSLWECTATGGSTTATVTWTGGTPASGPLNMSEWSGVTGFDVAAGNSNQGPSTSATTSSITPGATGELLIAFVGVGVVGYSGTPAGWTQVDATNYSDGFSDLVYKVGGSGSTSATWTVASSQNFASGIAAFSVAAAVPVLAATPPVSPPRTGPMVLRRVGRERYRYQAPTGPQGPDAPIMSTAVTAGAQAATVWFYAPPNYANEGIISYTVTASPGGNTGAASP